MSREDGDELASDETLQGAFDAASVEQKLRFLTRLLLDLSNSGREYYPTLGYNKLPTVPLNVFTARNEFMHTIGNQFADEIAPLRRQTGKSVLLAQLRDIASMYDAGRTLDHALRWAQPAVRSIDD